MRQQSIISNAIEFQTGSGQSHDLWQDIAWDCRDLYKNTLRDAEMGVGGCCEIRRGQEGLKLYMLSTNRMHSSLATNKTSNKRTLNLHLSNTHFWALLLTVSFTTSLPQTVTSPLAFCPHCFTVYIHWFWKLSLQCHQCLLISFFLIAQKLVWYYLLKAFLFLISTSLLQFSIELFFFYHMSF